MKISRHFIFEFPSIVTNKSNQLFSSNLESRPPSSAMSETLQTRHATVAEAAAARARLHKRH